MLFSSRTSASCCTAACHTRRPLKAFGSSPMVDAMAYSVRRTPSSRARPVGWNNSFRWSLGLRYDPTRQWSLRLGTAYPPPPWLHLPGSRGATRSPSAWRVTASLTPHTLSACLARRADRFDDAFSPCPRDAYAPRPATTYPRARDRRPRPSRPPLFHMNADFLDVSSSQSVVTLQVTQPIRRDLVNNGRLVLDDL